MLSVCGYAVFSLSLANVAGLGMILVFGGIQSRNCRKCGLLEVGVG